MPYGEKDVGGLIYIGVVNNVCLPNYNKYTCNETLLKHLSLLSL